MNDRDSHLLDRAFHEAGRAGWLRTAPNPRVGALALSGGHLVGRGFHACVGGAHAEESALRDAGAWDDGARRPRPGLVDEMVVTLEPCSASGGGKRRPACTALLQQAGVRRVVVAAEDPDPRHKGSGLATLHAAGVEVVRAPGGQSRFRDQNRAFTRALAHPRRPWVLLKWAATLDGKTAADNGSSQWITGGAAREEAHELRALADAVLAGTGTLRRDDPALTARPDGGLAGHQPLRVLVDAEGDPPAGARVFTVPGPRLWLLRRGGEPGGALRRRVEAEGDRILEVPPVDDGRLDLGWALERLRTGFGVRRLLVEGGARLQGSLLDLGLADSVIVYSAPLLLGGHHGALLGRGFTEPETAVRLTDEERADLGPDLRRAFLCALEPPA